MFHALSLKTKLIGVLLVFSTFLAIVGSIGFFSLNFMKEKYHKVAVDILPKTFATSELRSVVQFTAREMAHLADPQFTSEQRLSVSQHLTDRIERVDAAIAKLYSFNLTSGEREFVDEADADWKELRPVILQGIELAKSHTPESDSRLQKLAAVDVYNSMNKFSQVSIHIRKTLDAESEAELKATELSAQKSYLFNLIAVVVSIVTSVTFAFIFGTTLSRKLQVVSIVFTQNVNQIGRQAVEMAESGERLSQAVTKQATALQMTGLSIEEIREMVDANAEGARRSNSLALAGKEDAASSMQSVDRMLAAIETINSSVSFGFEELKTTVHQLETVVKVITEIGQKTNVINEIVFQTKLLSFNASVEAARAGEHGRGFAVVAEEIGNLAAMSGQASREITDMLRSGVASVNEVVTNTRTQIDRLTRESGATVKDGTVVANQCRDQLLHLSNGVTELQAAVAQIALANNEQVVRINNITNSVKEIDGVTELNRTLAQHAAQSSQSLKAHSELLMSSLSDLDQTINGNAA